MDWDAAYSNVDAVPDYMAHLDRYAAEAAGFRDGLGRRAELDIPYGEAPRAQLDLFRPEGTARGLAVFIHGGYWQRLDKSLFSALAAGALARGWAVAMPRYTLCPDIRVSGITAQMVAALSLAAARVSGPIRLAGHSAGGHLASRLVCTDVPVPDDVRRRIVHVLSISGVHDLRPLLRLEMNTVLGLDAAEAEAESPVLRDPVPETRLTAWVGAAELPEFVRQNALLANIWTGLGAETVAVEAPGLNHFDVIAPLAEADSALTAAWVAD